MERKVDILIADDHPAVRRGVRSILQLDHRFNIIGEAGDGQEAMEILAKQPAGLVMVDFKMPGMDGVETVRRLRKAYPNLKILAFSIYDEQFKVLSMLQAGADGYLLKSAEGNEIIAAITALMRGEKYVSKEVADKVIYDITSGKVYSPEEFNEAASLSRREIEVLKMLTQDNSYLEIAKKLHISKRTVDTHRYNISKKLGIKNLAGLIRYAINHGIA